MLTQKSTYDESSQVFQYVVHLALLAHLITSGYEPPHSQYVEF